VSGSLALDQGQERNGRRIAGRIRRQVRNDPGDRRELDTRQTRVDGNGDPISDPVDREAQNVEADRNIGHGRGSERGGRPGPG